MKFNKFSILLLTLIMLGMVNMAFAATAEENAKARAARRAAIQNSYHKTVVCDRISKNFRKDIFFSKSVYQFCTDNESSLFNFKKSIYPATNNDYENYKNVYPYNYAEFAVFYNMRQLAILREVVNNYCKYNSSKVRKKDPNACSQERIESLFAE